MTGDRSRASTDGTDRGCLRRHLCALAVVLASMALLQTAGRGSLGTPPLTSLEDLQAWLRARGGVAAGFAGLRLLALAMTWYLAAALVLSALAETCGGAAAQRVTRRVALPALGRLLTGVVGAGLAGTVALPGAMGGIAAADEGQASGGGPQAPAEPMILLDDGESGTGPTGDGTATMRWLAPGRAADGRDRGHRPAAPAPATPGPAVAPAPPAIGAGAHAGPDATSWTMAPGEHLWHVAETHLAESWDRPPADAETTRYWLALVEQNRSGLPDPANPDLVYPGHVVELPPVPPPPSA